MHVRRPQLSTFFTALALCASTAAAAPPLGDEPHAMDFNLGTWHADITQFPDPFAKPEESIHVAGTVVNRPFWGGKAQLEQIEAEGSSGHWESGALFLYDPVVHQWSQTGFDSNHGKLASPTIGGLHGDDLEFYGQTFVGGRTAFVRGTWSDISPNAHTYTIARSIDGGRTWHTSFVGHLTRIK